MVIDERAETPRSGLSRRGLVVGVSSVGAVAALGGLEFLFSAQAHADPLWRHPFTFPAVMGDGFRPPSRPNHNAVDYGYGGVTYNTPIYAVASGTVIGKRFTPGGRGSGSHGHDITIQHSDGWTSHYAHMNTPSLLNVGDSVPLSGYVGPVGSTGDSSGAHLHIELKHNGVYQNPALYIHHTVAPLAQPGSIPETQDEDMIQPIHSRVIRNTSTGDIAMLHPAGVALVGDPLIPDISSASGAGFLAGQPLGSGGYYWIDLPADRFGWEIARHEQLLAAIDNRIRGLIAAELQT